MRTIVVCLIILFVCSCRQNVDNSHSENSSKMTRHDEIRMIMRKHYISDLEDAYFLTDEEHDELRRLKKDYYADIRNRESTTLVVPGQGWEIRGPLSIERFKVEMIEMYNESSKIRNEVYKKFEDSGLGEAFAQFKRQFKEGDEIYFYKSDERSWMDLRGREGYVLVRKNEIVDKLLTAMN